MKIWLLATTVVTLAGTTPAFADTISFGQFGPQFSSVANGASGVTADGIGFVVNGSGMISFIQGSGFGGAFADDTPVLYASVSPITLTFDSGLASLTGIGIESNFYGSYTGTASYLNGTTLLNSISLDGLSAFAPGTVPLFSYTSGGLLITSVTFSSTNDGAGFAIGGAAAVPEPAIWALMIGGFGVVGAAARRRRTAVA